MDHTAKTDAELVTDTLAGDRAAFGQIYDRHARMVRAVVAAVSSDWSSVDDMTQECFLRAYRKLATLRDADRVAAWLAGFARQVARTRRTRPTLTRSTIRTAIHVQGGSFSPGVSHVRQTETRSCSDFFVTNDHRALYHPSVADGDSLARCLARFVNSHGAWLRTKPVE